MKNMFKLPVFIVGLLFLITGTAQKAAAQEEDVSLQTFYDELSPYGSWIQDPQYGYVWRPDVDQGDFRPYYTNGRWVMTEYGNTWVSDYNWGWAPFHYGRWIYNSYNEWVWIPDTTWGPAWVSWRSGGGYYGWAPLSPGININISFGGGYHIPNSWWCFVPQSNIYYDRFPRYRSYNNVTIINNTTIINNVYRGGRNTYYTGPGRDDIRRATNRDVRVYSINRTNRSDRGNITNNTVNIYNPRPSRGNSGGDGRPAPRNVTPQSEYIANRGTRTGRGDNNGARPATDNGRPISGAVTRGDRGTTAPAPDRNGATGGNNNTGYTPGTRPSRGGEFNPGRENTGTVNGRPLPPSGTPANNPGTGRPERSQPQPGQNDGTPRNYQPQRWQTRPVQQQPQPQPQVQPQQPQRGERVQPPQQMQRPVAPQPQPQPQQQRPAVQPQPQRPERQQQQAPPPQRENRGNGGESRGGGETRGERGGRG